MTATLKSQRSASPQLPWIPGSPEHRKIQLMVRRRMMLLSIPVAVVVLLLAAKLLSVSIASAQLDAAFAKGDAAGVHSAAGVLKFVNVIEPYKAWFNDGDGYVLDGDFAAAKTEFEKALSLAPQAESCQVRVNLVLTLEKLGDAKAQARDGAAAKSLYDQGVKVVDDALPGCFQPGSSGNRQGEGRQLQDSKARLEQKSQQMNPQNQPGQTPPPAEQPQGQAPSPSKLDQLNQQNNDAQQDRSDGGQIRDGSGNAPPFDPNAKQW